MNTTHDVVPRFGADVGRLFRLVVLIAIGGFSLALAQTETEREKDTDKEEQVTEELVVRGSRKIVRNQIEIKRDAVTIVDGISADEIDNIPALSIGEALETLTGASSHRENGGATEISIRGLGPFLSATFFNGREATNGSGDRAVNFSQFPSELMSKLAISKTQDAALIEGGVAGVIQLETLKPLNFSERRFQLDLKGNFNPDQQNIRDAEEGDLGARATLSYVDQFELPYGGAFGISLGYQISDTSQPEAEVRGSSPTGSSLWACINDPDVTNEGFHRDSSGDCEDQIDGSNNQGYDTRINPETGQAYSAGSPFAFAPSSRGFRQNDTSEERDSYFGAFQWRPNDAWDINLDLQFSERVQAEQRHDLNFANQRRVTPGVTGPNLVTTANGAVVEWMGTTAIESNSEVYSRTEDYMGGGLNVRHRVNPQLSLTADLSFSETTREELQISLRTQSDNQDIFNQDTPGGYQPLVSWNTHSGIPQFTITNFDVTDHRLFSDEYRVRIDSDVDRTNRIQAARLDMDWMINRGGIHHLQAGVRVSEQDYLNLGGTRFTTGNLDDSSQEERDLIALINQECAIPFPESDFLASQRDGNLVTHIDSETGEVLSGTGNQWATFDTMCVTRMILAAQGTEFAYPAQIRESPSTTDVTEATTAAYAMATYGGVWGERAYRGNFGVRAVNTAVTSRAYRTDYEIITDTGGFLSIQPVADGGFERVSAKHDYTELLPSFNIVVNLSDDHILRGGIYRAMSRPDPGDLGYNRSFQLNGAEDITDPNDLINNVSGSGNPFTDPLMSWNLDTSIEWYANADSLLAASFYFKQFTGGFEQVRFLESFQIDGQPIEAEYTVSQTNDDTSDLYGIELTVTHRFSRLPGVLKGLGTKLSYNYADSDFEFEDSNYGTVTLRNLDGSTTQLTQGIIAPGNVPGFSEHVFSGQLYYQLGEFDTQVLYKYRSEYFQPYTSNGTRLRYVGDVGVWEARASYRLSKSIKINVTGINLFDEPKQTYYYTNDNFGERNVYGPRYFFGLQSKF
ncbi:TonB-dependent receptor [Acanthopleuribacter pedis]|uniref:TonB-dependent receptor n=1 Tax=Acanthopleuribacter pedis TaxID=442870 RepID=A0A8J7QAL7_9BACT|nr:TonB-dependent receptor [Acanthopleuribacter pedis]MBO1321916.1 TonB-dependent receptor [Acanthopleuribacter pedis]